jgi:hypothetical protein
MLGREGLDPMGFDRATTGPGEMGWIGSGWVCVLSLGRAEEAKAQGVRGAPADLGLMVHKHMWAEKDERKR